MLIVYVLAGGSALILLILLICCCCDSKEKLEIKKLATIVPMEQEKDETIGTDRPVPVEDIAETYASQPRKVDTPNMSLQPIKVKKKHYRRDKAREQLSEKKKQK